MLGKLTWEAIPLSQPLPLVASGVVALLVLGVLAWIVIGGHLPYLWREWITSVDHKRIGVMYCALALAMLIRGFSDAILMRTQQALAYQSPGYLPPEHYDQIFSAHGTIMIFFGAMPFIVGLMNFVVPLQLGVRDVAFPTLNSVSFWLTATGALLVNISLVVGEFARTGWWPSPPLSETTYSPGVGVDYYLWAIQISGIGTLLSGVNLVTTILKIRAPGMSYLRMPMFCWTSLASNLLIVAAFPILTATLAMLTLDRYLGFHFFTDESGGNSMMFMNLFWAWGHPEVYILALPAYGIFSEVISTFSGKPLFAYRSMVGATMAIFVLAFMVWLHHFFTMGAGGDVNGIFGITSMIIAVPTGVKIFDWLFTMYGGRIRLTTPMLWSLAFMITFVVGGATGVLLAIPPADFVLHNSMFLVAHFHNVMVSAVLFGAFAGYTFWFPKAFGFQLDEWWGKVAFWFSVAGYVIVFTPFYVLGLMGMTRRMQHYDIEGWRPWILIAGFGVAVMLIGVICQIVQLVVSIRRRESLRDLTGDPWDGRSLEWATASPPPVFNFAVMPRVEGEEAYWTIKQRAREQARLREEPDYEPVEMPLNSPMYGGRIRLTTPMLWSLAFMITFVVGGATGVLLAIPPADFVLHNSMFLVAHFHNVMVSAVLFGAVRRLHLLVPESVRFPARRMVGQGRVLVLCGGLRHRVHAVLRARPDGHDPPHAALRHRRLAPLDPDRRFRRRGDAHRGDLPDRPARGQHPGGGRACATSPATPGTDAPSNGRRPRRRRCSTSR